MTTTCFMVLVTLAWTSAVVPQSGTYNFEDNTIRNDLCQVNVDAQMKIANRLSMLTKYLENMETKITNMEEKFDAILKNMSSRKCETTKPVTAEPRSCAEVKSLTGTHSDGEYWLYLPAGQRVRIYCHDLAGEPQEFLTLPNTNSGEHPNIGNLNCHETAVSPLPQRSGSSHFTKIRVNIQTMVVDRSDYTFAVTTGRPVPYGEASDCYSIHYSGQKAECGILGNFHIDTRGTGLVVDQSLRWMPRGWRPYVTWHRSDDDAVIDLTCGGWCGGCVPDGDIRLTFKTATPGNCSDIQVSDPAAEDGRYDVYPEAVGGLRVGVYCHAMNGTPQEYITLNHPNEGVYPNLANKNCHGETETESPKKTGKSTFHKIRIDLKTMIIDPTDYTFAETEGVPVPYGVAKDCYSIHYGGKKAECGIKGTFNIDTSGTGLIIDKQTRWLAKGWMSYAETKRSEDGAVVNLLCGGWCGGCKADRALRLTIDPNNVDFRSCADLKAMDPTAEDGEYVLYPRILGGEGLFVYCDNMADYPKEYLSLQTLNTGVSPRLSNPGCKGEIEGTKKPEHVGFSEFSKIGINIETLEVNQTDYKFATTGGHPVTYGRAYDCYTAHYESFWTDAPELAACGTKGEFTINTSGTGLRVNTTMEWIRTGNQSYSSVTRSGDGAVVTLQCGGYCGGCVPEHQIFLEINPQEYKK